MEHKIGEIVTLPDGRKAEVVEARTAMEYYYCENCAYKGKGKSRCINELGRCEGKDRADHKNIIYKEIVEEQI